MAFRFLMRHNSHVVFQARNNLSLSLCDLREAQELFTGRMIFPKLPIVLSNCKLAKLLHFFVGFNIFYFTSTPDLTTLADGTGATRGFISDEADWAELESGGDSKGEKEVYQEERV
jgi:hypothetical protein